MSLLWQSSCSGVTVDLLIGLSILSAGERPREKHRQELLRICLCFQQHWVRHLDYSCEDMMSAQVSQIIYQLSFPVPVNTDKYIQCFSDSVTDVIFLNSSIQRQTATVLPPCLAVRTVKKVRDIYSTFIKTSIMSMNLNWIFTTETSQEEPPVTNWNELSIIERVGLNRWQ